MAKPKSLTTDFIIPALKWAAPKVKEGVKTGYGIAKTELEKRAAKKRAKAAHERRMQMFKTSKKYAKAPKTKVEPYKKRFKKKK